MRRRAEGRFGPDPGDAALHEPRAGRGQAARPPDRPLLAGRDALRVRHRDAAVPGPGDGGDRQPRRGPPRPAPVEEPGDLAGAGGVDPPAAGEEPRGAPGLGGRVAARPPRREVERERHATGGRRRSRRRSPSVPNPVEAAARTLDDRARPARARRGGRDRPRGGRDRGRRRGPWRRRPAPPLARAMLADVLAEPIALSPDERYLCGHYLAYLLGGSRRRGIFLPTAARPAQRRPRPAAAGDDLADHRRRRPTRRSPAAAELLEPRPDVRASLNPIVVTKYLGCRDTPAKRKGFRQARRRLQEASAYAAEAMTDANGVLNPGLMPQVLDDLRKIAPAQAEVDDQLVGRWNRVAEVWRDDPDFRQAVLGYATSDAGARPGQRRPLARGRLPADRARPLAAPVARRRRGGLGLPLRAGAPPPRRRRPARPGDPGGGPFAGRRAARRRGPRLRRRGGPRLRHGRRRAPATDSESFGLRIGHGVSLHELAADGAPATRPSSASPRPTRSASSRATSATSTRRRSPRCGPPAPGRGTAPSPVGPYRLAVIPSIRGRSAGQVAVPGDAQQADRDASPPRSASAAGGNKPILAAWTYAGRQPGDRLRRLQVERALHPLARPARASSTTSTTPASSTTPSTTSAWRPPTSSTAP